MMIMMILMIVMILMMMISRYLLGKAESLQGKFEGLYPSLLRLASAQFPHLCLVSDWLTAEYCSTAESGTRCTGYWYLVSVKIYQ